MVIIKLTISLLWFQFQSIISLEPHFIWLHEEKSIKESFVLQIIATLIVLVTAKPIEIDEDHADIGAVSESSADGHQFGDRLNPYAPTTPRDAANLYSLSYIQDNYPDQPVQEDPEAPPKTKRSLESDISANKHFFDDIFNGFKRNVRKALPNTDGSTNTSIATPVPTIAISDLLHSVENTLFHSAQNLAIANATNTTSFNSSETSTVISLPISLPTPMPVISTANEEAPSTTYSNCEHILERLQRSENDGVPAPEGESVKSLPANGGLSLLSPIVFSAAHTDPANILQGHIEATEETPIATTFETTLANITIIQTINSTQTIPTVDGHREQEQHITLFSAADGVFPILPSVPLAHYDATTEVSSSGSSSTSASSISSKSSDSNSSSSSSEESHDSKKKCSEDSSSEESSEEVKKCLEKLVVPIVDSKKTSPTEPSTTTETLAEKEKKVEILKQKIAEVAADPVILTQGI